MTYAELQEANLNQEEVSRHILTGGYPEIWDEKLIPYTWMNSYVQTYVQRDVRLLRNITNLAAFNRFIHFCANYAGQLLNRDDLARQTGVDNKTILSWLGLLENSYVIFLLQPWHTNRNKRLIKTPKLYFYDTGVLCYLLGLKSSAAVQKSQVYGALFENWLISEIRKNGYNKGENNNMYFFRDSTGNEVDLILEKGDGPMAIEIKSGTKPNNNMLNGLKYWQKSEPKSQGILLHGGQSNEMISEQISILPWTEVVNL